MKDEQIFVISVFDDQWDRGPQSAFSSLKNAQRTAKKYREEISKKGWRQERLFEAGEEEIWTLCVGKDVSEVRIDILIVS